MPKHRDIDRTTDAAFSRYQQRRVKHWDSIATSPSVHNQSSYYHARLTELYRFLIPPGQRIIEIGSGTGDLLAGLEPGRGLGVDFSRAMVKEAAQRHPELEFMIADAHSLHIDETFDIVILSDIVTDLWDIQAVLEQILTLCTPNTRIVMNFYNKVWQGPLGLARRLGFADPVQPQNWLSTQDVKNLLHLSGFEVVTSSGEILMPVRMGPFTQILNRILVKIWPFRYAALTDFIVARPELVALDISHAERSVSVVVPARNESGNIDAIIARTPQMGSYTELIFVEGNSTDDTYAAIEEALLRDGTEHVTLLRQPGEGKGDAVRHGFAHATGDILMILDADMTVAPEELPRFYRAITNGTAEFVNGVRLIYPMEGEAMQFLNYLGNKLFGVTFSWLLKQPVKDTLCGTKVLTRESYEVIARNRSYFGDFDPFGDFDLLFGAAKSNLKIIDMPIRYRDRTYGDTNIDRWRHGALLLRMVLFAARKLRFI